MERSARLLPLLAVLAACVVNPHAGRPDSQGLERIRSQRVEEVYRARGASLASYRGVLLDPVVASQANQSHPDWTEQQTTQASRLNNEAAAAFGKILGEALAADGGYEIATGPGPGVLRVAATLRDLVINVPATSSADAAAAMVSTGKLVVSVELRDSVSNKLLLRASDRPRGREFGQLQVDNAINNSAEVKRAFTYWAGLLRSALDEAR